MKSIISLSEEFSKITNLKNKIKAILRPIKITDDQMLYDFFYSCSKDTLYFRFMNLSIYNSLRRNESQYVMNIIRKYTNIDFNNHVSIVALIKEYNKEKIVSKGMYIKTGENRAEIAFITADDWQRQGLAINIGNLLKEIAISRGIKIFEGDLLLSNRNILNFFRHLKIKYNSVTSQGSIHFEINLIE